MILAMILAHLVGDFILQTDKLAYWKTRDLRAIGVHGLIILFITGLFAVPFKPFWWQGVLFITITHVAIDTVQLYFKPPVAPVIRFFIDQLLHFVTIFMALAAGGYLDFTVQQSVYGMEMETILIVALGYAFLTMPTWVLLKFVGYAVVEGSPPVFPDRFNKYAGITERVLILTVILAGIYLLVPLLAMPRMIIERRKLENNSQRPLLLFECVAGVCLAIVVGLAVRAILGAQPGPLHALVALVSPF